MSGEDSLQHFAIELIAPVFRIGSKHRDPMTTPPRDLQGMGRFDDPTIDSEPDPGGYSVLYAASESRAAFLEVLYGYRTPVSRLKFIANEMVLDAQERDQLLGENGKVPVDWIRRSVLMESTLQMVAPVFDLANPTAVQAIRERLAGLIFELDIDDLDFATVLGGNRRFTQTLSRWLWTMTDDSGNPRFSGIRYRSRFDPDSICLALFQDRYEVDGDIESQPITSESPGFAEAASVLRLKIS